MTFLLSGLVGSAQTRGVLAMGRPEVEERGGRCLLGDSACGRMGGGGAGLGFLSDHGPSQLPGCGMTSRAGVPGNTSS